MVPIHRTQFPLLFPYLGQCVIVEVQPSAIMVPTDLNISDEEFNDRINKSSLVVLRGMDRDTVFAYTEVQDIHGYIFNYSKRYTGILQACGMRKPINRLGNAFNWPNVYYRNIMPWNKVEQL